MITTYTLIELKTLISQVLNHVVFFGILIYKFILHLL